MDFPLDDINAAAARENPIGHGHSPTFDLWWVRRPLAAANAPKRAWGCSFEQCWASVTAHTKILMGRCQSLWAKKYWIEKVPFGKGEIKRKGLFISVGATHGKKLFDGAFSSVRYFFDAIDAEVWRMLLFRGLDLEGEILQHREYLQEAYEAVRELALSSK